MSATWYENKLNFHNKQKELAHAAGAKTTAAHHENESKNYRELLNQELSKQNA